MFLMKKRSFLYTDSFAKTDVLFHICKIITQNSIYHQLRKNNKRSLIVSIKPKLPGISMSPYRIFYSVYVNVIHSFRLILNGIQNILARQIKSIFRQIVQFVMQASKFAWYFP